MNRHLIRSLKAACALTTILGSQTTWAQTTPTSQPDDHGQPQDVPATDAANEPDIIVNGQQFKGQATPMALSVGPSSDIASVTVLSGEDIARQTLASNIDVFRSIPGVQVGDFGQVGIAQGVSFRGWPGAQDSASVAFFLDNVQRNEPSGTGANGYLDINPVITEVLDDVTVVKGPFDTRYGGSFALAGSFVATTVDSLPSRIALSGGSYGHYRGLLALGGTSGEVSYYTAIRGVSDDGYQANADQRQYTTFSKVTAPLGSGKLRVSLHTYDLKHGSPGYLDLANLRAGLISRRDATSRTDGGAKHQYTLVAGYSQGDRDAGFEATAYGETQKRYRYATFTPLPQAKTRNERDFYGLSGDGHYRLPTIGGFETLLQAGLSVRRDDIDTVRQPSVDRVAIETPTPFDAFGYGVASIHQTQLGAYVSAVIKRGDWMKLSLGVRYDRDEYDVRYQSYVSATNAFRVQNLDKTADRFTPKLGLALSPWSELTLFANYAQSVAAPDAVREVPLASADLGMPTLTTQEVGAAWNPLAGRIHLQASYYDTRNSDEFLLFNGLLVNQGESKRRGYDIEASALAYDSGRLRIRAYGNYSRIHARLSSGGRIAAVADWVGSYGLRADYDVGAGGERLLLDLGQQWTGPQALEAANRFRSDAYSRITTKLSYEMPERRNLRLWTEGTFYPGSTHDEFGFVILNRVYVTSLPSVRINVGATIDF